MSDTKKPEDALRPHLSALVDGELEPLEAIAVQRAVRQSADLERECQNIEQLKLAVHLAGTRDSPDEAIGERLRAMIAAQTESAREAGKVRRLFVPLAAVALAALALVFAWTAMSGPGSVDPATVRADLTQTSLARLVAVHKGVESPMSLYDLQASGTLITLEPLPGSFISAEGERARVVQASYAHCDESQGGPTLAVLKADQVGLPPGVTSALDTSGVFVDVIDDVEVRLSRSGNRLFVLLSEILPVGSSNPI